MKLCTALCVIFLFSCVVNADQDCSKLKGMQKQICHMQAARQDGWRECLKAPDVPTCIGTLSVDMRSPQPILDLTAPSDGIAIYGEQERDALLAIYVQMTLDTDAGTI